LLGLAFFFESFHRQDYAHALLELQNHNPTHSFWVHALYGATLAKLGRNDEAKVHIKQLAEQKPDFASRGRDLFGRTIKNDASIENVIDGLRIGGLAVE
jgi:predicted Zn-dependent protease